METKIKTSHHFHWSVFVIVILAVAAGLLIYIQKFKTDEEIDSLVPINSSMQGQQSEKESVGKKK